MIKSFSIKSDFVTPDFSATKAMNSDKSGILNYNPNGFWVKL